MKIAIAGAGIGGLAVAALLARDGHDVHVFDKFDQPEPVGSGLVIQPVGQAVMTHLGIDGLGDSLGCRISRMLGLEVDSGRTTLDVSYTRSGAHRFGLALHRAALFDALFQCAMAAGATLHTGHRVAAALADPPRLTFEHGQTSEPFDLIVDALGAASPLSPLVARPLPFGALWGTVDWPAETVLPPDQLSQMYRRADRMLGVLPIGKVPGQSGDKATIFWSLPADSYADWRARPIADWIAQATGLWPEMAPFLAQISHHDQLTMARYSHGTLKRPWQDGIAHIGDAAHRASPQLGQGANMALLDAFALAAALRQANGREALALYGRLRRWHVRLYQGMSWAFTPQYQSHSRVLPLLRDRLLAPVSQIPPMPWVLSRLVCGDLIQPFAGLTDP